MRKVFLFLSLFYISAFSFSQEVPGYLGKKFGVSYNFNFFPFPDRMVFNKEVDYQPWTFANKHEVNLCLTTSRKVTFNFAYSLLWQNYPFINRQRRAASGEFNTSAGKGNYYFIPDEQKYKVAAHFFDMALRIYVSKFIAPVGTYHQLRVGYVLYGLAAKENYITGNLYDGYFYGYSGQQNIPVYEDVKLYARQPWYKAVRLSYGLGNLKPIFNDVMYFSYGINLNFFFHNDYNKFSNRDYVRDYIRMPLSAFNTFDFHIGLGYFFK